MGLRYDTQIITPQGWRQINEVGTEVVVAQTFKYVFELNNSRQKGLGQKIVYATNGQRWDLGTVVPSNSSDQGFDGNWWLQGFKYGLGHPGGSITVPLRCEMFRQRVSQFAQPDEPRARIPYELQSSLAIGSFIRGWVNTCPSMVRLVTTDREALDWFMEHAPFAGYVITGKPRYELEKKGRGTQIITCHDVAFTKGTLHPGWRVAQRERLPNDMEAYYVAPNPVVLRGGITAIFS